MRQVLLELDPSFMAESQDLLVLPLQLLPLTRRGGPQQSYRVEDLFVWDHSRHPLVPPETYQRACMHFTLMHARYLVLGYGANR